MRDYKHSKFTFIPQWKQQREQRKQPRLQGVQWLHTQMTCQTSDAVGHFEAERCLTQHAAFFEGDTKLMNDQGKEAAQHTILSGATCQQSQQQQQQRVAVGACATRALAKVHFEIEQSQVLRVKLFEGDTTRWSVETAVTVAAELWEC
jgi:hypothetical protein